MKEYRYILMGPPGVGKGTYAKHISEKLNIKHISTGDIFRYHIKNKTSLGLKASSFIEKGLLVPDSLTNELVLDRLSQDDVKNGFLLDGYPRNSEQAKYLEKILSDKNTTLTGAINFYADDKIIIERLSGRRTCPKCGSVYHILYNKPLKDGICNSCSEVLEIRKDDTEEVIKNRLKVYKESFDGLKKYYVDNNLIIDICADLDFSEQKDDVVNKLI